VATKKQRRRREKGRRHEYEFVYVDEEGQEVEVDEPEPKPRKAADRKPAPGAKNAKAAKTGARPERTVEPPSWERTFRRAAIFVPLMVVFLYFTRRKGSSTVAIAVPALFLGVVLILFMYGMDSLLYRSYQKRMDKRGGSPPKSK
jgi:hypothetical protein